MNEIWRDVPGYDGWYQASDEGRVRSWRGVGGNGGYEAPRRDVPLIFKQARTRGGYLFVNLCKNGIIKSYRVNRLTLLTFTGEAPSGLHACHRNGDRTDNRESNLYWGTTAENQADKHRHGTQIHGEATHNSELTDADVAEMRLLWARPGRPSAIDMGKRFGVSGPTAWKAATGKTWTHLPMPEVAGV